MGSGKYFSVWYKGQVIGEIKAASLSAALLLANQLYSGPVTVTAV